MLLSPNFWAGAICLLLALITVPHIDSLFDYILVVLGFILGVANIYFAWRAEE